MKGLAKITLLATLAISSCTSIKEISIPNPYQITFPEPTEQDKFVLNYMREKGMESYYFHTLEQLRAYQHMILSRTTRQRVKQGKDVGIIIDIEGDGDYDFYYSIRGKEYFLQQRAPPQVKEIKTKYIST